MTTDNYNITYFTKIKSKKIKWLWYPYIPYGKITLIEGDPGEGKTSLVLSLISLMSTGSCLPFTNTKVSGISIYQNDEDDIADTIKPRLQKENANCNNVCFIDSKETPLFIDDDVVEKAIVETGAKLLVFDPIQSYMGKNVDMNKASSVRPILKRLKETAERTGCAIVLVRHLSKTSNKNSLYRGLGSIDITAAARSVLYVGKDPDNRDTGYIVQQKNNLAPFGKSIEFKITNSKIQWIAESEITMQDLVKTVKGKPSKIDIAKDFIKKILSNGPLLATDVFHLAAVNNISKHTLNNAKKELPIISTKTKNGWIWEIKHNQR